MKSQRNQIKMANRGFVAPMLLLLCVLPAINGHGYLLEPPSRSSMWRVGFKTPRNYNDNALYCGGFWNQYGVQGGKCGICGDPYQGPRKNEAGGIYATGIISRKYTEGQTIDVTVVVTANHLGWFEFKVCPNNNPQVAATQECLDRYVLQMADGSGSKLYIGTAEGAIRFKLKLPTDVTCSQCVLQWRWHTAKDYGTCPDGTHKVGCGLQEEFYGCSDIAISGTLNHLTPNPQGNQWIQPPTPPNNKNQPAQPLTPNNQPLHALTPPGNNNQPIFSVWGRPQAAVVSSTPSPIIGQGGVKQCYAIAPLWRGQPNMDAWCQSTCENGACPSTVCACN